MSGELGGGPQPLGPREEEALQPDLAPQAEVGGPAPANAPTPATARTLRQHLAPYYTPPPAAREAQPRAKPKRRPLAIAGVLTTIGLGLAAWHFLGPGIGQWTLSRQKADMVLFVSEPDLDRKATEQLKDLLAEPSLAAPVLASDPNPQAALSAANAEALTSLAHPREDANPESHKLAESLQEGERMLYRVHVLDFLAQDGDEVELFVDGVSFGAIPLHNVGKDILIPLQRGTSVQMRIVATRDGGGGVTFGLVSSLDEAKTRVMQVGDSEQWWVTVK